jgi:hypothetical protein
MIIYCIPDAVVHPVAAAVPHEPDQAAAVAVVGSPEARELPPARHWSVGVPGPAPPSSGRHCRSEYGYAAGRTLVWTSWARTVSSAGGPASP